jgi:integrase
VIARHYSPADGRKYLSIGSADDLLDADGGDTLTFAQAQVRAADWFRDIERSAGRVMQPITVAEATEAYVTDYLARGGKAERDLRTTIKAHILPDLGGKEVASLTNATLRAWHHRLAAAPARLRTSAKAKRANVRPPEDAEGRRARRSTANRVLTVLKAALSLAYRDGRVPSDDAWRRVKPFPNVDAPRIRYLTDDEAVRLVNACGQDLRALVTAALLTAMRYGELARLRAADFDPDAGVLHIREAKAGKPRTVPLTGEGRRFFSGIAAGKPGRALLLTSADGAAWGKSHQHRPLMEACAAARIAPAASFHILRHTAASRLVQRGVPMAVIGALLGNTEAICARHYAHLSPSYVNETIRQAAGELGIVPGKTNVQPLRARAGG